MEESYIYLQTEFLSNPIKGLVTVTSYWTCGKITEEIIPKYPPIFVLPLDY